MNDHSDLKDLIRPVRRRQLLQLWLSQSGIFLAVTGGLLLAAVLSKISRPEAAVPADLTNILVRLMPAAVVISVVFIWIRPAIRPWLFSRLWPASRKSADAGRRRSGRTRTPNAGKPFRSRNRVNSAAQRSSQTSHDFSYGRQIPPATAWLKAARTIDRCCDLKDRTVTALQFSSAAQPSVFQQLQIAETLRALQSVDRRRIVPLSIPRTWYAAALMFVLAGALWSAPVRSSRTLPPVDAAAVAAASEQLEDTLQDIDSAAEAAGMEQLRELVGRMRQEVRHLKQPDGDLRQTLRSVSQMQQQLQQAAAEYDADLVDAQLKQAADALAASKEFQQAAEAMRNEDYDRAADKLDEVSPENISANEARQLNEQLREAAESAEEQDLKRLSEKLNQLAEAVSENQQEKTHQADQDLAQELRQHSLRRQVSQMLKAGANELADAKQMLAAESNSSGDGQMAGEGLNQTEGKTETANNSGSRKAGAKSAGNIDGEKTRLDSQRQIAELTGKLGDQGETDIEKISSTDFDDQAKRRVQETFAEYRQMSEAVLDAEQIPPSHRRTIREYFQRIRPESATKD
ncbi:MAG: hypothetical protein KDA89_13605 [Planctomycetaceae bacterium]|nr:hypothetical protein [Planctomycetaceae bacterium]